MQYITKQYKIIVDECANTSFNEYVNTLSKSTSAVLSYGLIINANKEKIVLIFDIGGGTTNITIVSISNTDGNNEATNNEHVKCKVLNTASNTALGSDDVNSIIYQWVL